MKIVELQISNLRKIEAVGIFPKSNVMKIEGKNGAGKTTVLDSILYALAGGQIPEDVIKDGKEKAEIKVNIGDYIIKKIITDQKAYLEVTTKEGHLVKSPQTFLNDIVGQIAFDPMSFKTMSDKKQAEVITQVLGLDKDINKLKDDEASAMEDRKLTGREKDKLALLCKDIIEEVPEPQGISEIVSDIQRLSKIIADKKDQYAKFLNMKKEQEENENEIVKLEKQIDKLKNQNRVFSEKLKAVNLVHGLTEIKDHEKEITKKNEILKNQEDEVKKYNQYKAYSENKNEYNKVCKKHETLDKKIEKIRENQKEILTSAKLPIKNLKLTEDALLYEDRTFSNACESAKLKISIALSMAINPKLKVILIREGSLLDEDSLKEIEKMADKEDYQLWIEKVSSSKDDDSAILIEEGKIKE